MSKISLCLLICAVTLGVFAEARNAQYCNLASCKGKPHTSCLFSPKTPAAFCGKVFSSGVSEAQKNEILRAHNTLRRKVASGQETRGNPGPQPGSRNIHDLEWSSELAEIAQTWANQCIFKHDQCRNTPAGWVGQNLAESSVYGQDNKSLTSMIQGWYDEVQYVDRNLVSSYVPKGGPAIGHYTQMVWGKTTSVGCGVVVYNNDGPWITTYLVCNYGPGGNVIGQPMY